MPSIVIKSKHRSLNSATMGKSIDSVMSTDLHPNTRYHDFFLATTFVVTDKVTARIIKCVDGLFVEGTVIPYQVLMMAVANLPMTNPNTRHPVDVHISL